MTHIQDKMAFTDISIIIGMMPEIFKEKIDSKFIKIIEKYKDKEYKSNINPEIPLKNQELNHDTKVLLALIYKQFLCENKKNYDYGDSNIFLKQYGIEDLFKNNINEEKNKTKEQTAMVEYKKTTFISLIFNKIKKYIHK